jgi:phage tail-like protein
MASSVRIDPFTIGKFLVSIGGITSNSFSEVSGLDLSIDVIDYREGNSRGPFDQKLPGLNLVSNVTLKRGLTPDLSLWTWINTVVTSNIQRKGVQITLLDQYDYPVLVWKIHNGHASGQVPS